MSDPSSTPSDAPGRLGPFAAIGDQLPDGATAVRAAGFTRLRHGHAPGTDDLAADTGLDADTVTRTLTGLARRGAAELDDNGRLVGIGGLSLVPTAHELVLDGVALHTWCAVDALGIPAALGADATARTHCPHCGQAIEVTLIAGTPTHPAPITTWYPPTPPAPTCATASATPPTPSATDTTSTPGAPPTVTRPGRPSPSTRS